MKIDYNRHLSPLNSIPATSYNYAGTKEELSP